MAVMIYKLRAFILYGAGCLLLESQHKFMGVLLIPSNTVLVLFIGIKVYAWMQAIALLAAKVYVSCRLLEAVLLVVGALAMLLIEAEQINRLCYRLTWLVLAVMRIWRCC